MSTSLKKRCIRRWTVEFKGRCDSKHSPYWRKYHLRGMIRECAMSTADCMVGRQADSNAEFDHPGRAGWSPEFSAWYTEHREQYHREALKYLDREATNDEIDEEIQTELDCWND